MPARSPYETVEPFGLPLPSWVPESAGEDRDRVRAYETYEDVFHNVPSAFVAVLKEVSGNEVLRRLVPSARTIVEGTNRYLANGLTWVAELPAAANAADPAASAAVGSDVADAAIATTMAALNGLFTREAFVSRFMALKRWMLIRGDALLHVTLDPAKGEGSRISIREVMPNTYFVIPDPADAERVIGCYLVNIVLDDEGEEIAARLEYQRITDADRSAEFEGAPIGTVFRRLTFWEVDGWDGRGSPGDLAPVATPARFAGDRFATMLVGDTLPAGISAIPVYHFRNNARGGVVFGTSEIQGIETLIAGVNQTTTDQEVTVALQGLGVYWTTSGKAIDNQGNDIPWSISPASMLQLQDGKAVGRLEGVTTVQPSLDHIGLFDDKMQETTGTPAIAVGIVEVSAAESGVSRAIQFAPILSKNAEKQEHMQGVLNQMLHDLLTGWLTQDGYTDNGVTVSAEFGPILPTNDGEVIEAVTKLVTAKVVSAEWARQQLTEKLGYQFSATEADNINSEANALLDGTGVRLDAAVAGAPTGVPDTLPAGG